jgi:tetratricopeptide (TPR) repeat protein
MTLLGSNADEQQNWRNALEVARAEAVANPNDPFAWFNMGTNFVGLDMFAEAAVAYDQARNVGEGLPWRMMWYQFGPFEAYMATGRYQDVIDLAQANLNDGGGQYVEETYYYAGLARAGLGETDRAVLNLDGAISFNPNFTPAREAKARIQGG